MRKRFGTTLLLIVGLTSSIPVKVCMKDTSLDAYHTFFSYYIFDSTVSMQAPFKVKEEVLNNPGLKSITKESTAVYQSSNYIFIAACIELVKGVCEG